MSQPTEAARAAGEAWIKSTEWVQENVTKYGDDLTRAEREMVKGRRVVTALLEALRARQGSLAPLLRQHMCTRTLSMQRMIGGIATHGIRCACGWESTSHPNEGQASLAWVDHVAVLAEEARPALTVETLAKALEEWSAGDPDQLFTDDEWCAALAAWLLPRLAGPAQEGPHA